MHSSKSDLCFEEVVLFFFFFNLFIFGCAGLRCCSGFSLLVVCRLLVDVDFFVVEQGL